MSCLLRNSKLTEESCHPDCSLPCSKRPQLCALGECFLRLVQPVAAILKQRITMLCKLQKWEHKRPDRPTLVSAATSLMMDSQKAKPPGSASTGRRRAMKAWPSQNLPTALNSFWFVSSVHLEFCIPFSQGKQN